MNYDELFIILSPLQPHCGTPSAMGSRRNKKTILDDLYEQLVLAPWWIGPIVAAIGFATFQFAVPWVLMRTVEKDVAGKTLSNILTPMSIGAAPWVTLVIGMIWLFAMITKMLNRKRLDRQTGIESIRELSWHEFERLLAEAYRRQGYAVELVGGSGPDGGVDIRLHRAGEVLLVQCKQWRERNVGVKLVRELYGVVAAERANRGILVTSGRFSADAVEFASGVAITLVAGDELANLIAEVQRSSLSSASKAPQAVAECVIETPDSAPSVPLCPTCGAKMVSRVARNGSNAGSKFWGCSRYPGCRGTRRLVDSAR